MSHALSYITASKNGVSEPEIEDLISLDDKVLDGRHCNLYAHLVVTQLLKMKFLMF